SDSSAQYGARLLTVGEQAGGALSRARRRRPPRRRISAVFKNPLDSRCYESAADTNHNRRLVNERRIQETERMKS
ncbi:MAG TPA: hypothetical protein PK405_09125, partial [Hyphomicrobiales bacterium]|nr:hypothetical protein [Hyphomicrobiales bacterium]